MSKTMKDGDGDPVKAGDVVCFSYGIPPVSVSGRLIEVDGELVLPTPGHKPTSITLRALRKMGMEFYKLEDGRA